MKSAVMQTKIKIFVVFLAVSAIVSVLSLFNVFSGLKSALFYDSIQPLPPVVSDTDGDGLNDKEESYWDTDLNNPDSDGDGFLDGEEVASGHDPKTAGPDDELASKNITEKMANLALGGLAEGTLKKDSPTFNNSVDTLALSVVNDGVDSFMPTLKFSDLKLTEPTKEAQQIYATQMQDIWDKFTKAIYKEIGEMGAKIDYINKGGMANAEYIDYFTSQKIIFRNIAQEALQLPVPKNWTDNQIDFLNLASSIAEINSALAQGKDDPIRATVGFNLFITSVEKFPTTLQAFVSKLESEHISLK
jgi:hypothetical protein